MNKKLTKEEKKVLELFQNSKRRLTDKKISEKTGIPLRKVNIIARKLIEEGKVKNISPLKLPKKITLLNQIFDIKFGAIKKDDCLGHIDFRKREIIIEESLDRREDRNEIIFILIHELCHYFAVYYRLENSETFANAMTQFIFTIFNQLNFEIRN